jgi:hypothetical protein
MVFDGWWLVFCKLRKMSRGRNLIFATFWKLSAVYFKVLADGHHADGDHLTSNRQRCLIHQITTVGISKTIVFVNY